jgi:ribose transport system substrate-binding protein
MPSKACLALAVAACLLGGCSPRTSYKYRVAVIPKGLTHEFWQSIHRGADRAAGDLAAEGASVEVLWDGPRKESDALEQRNLVAEKAGLGINGLVLAPQDRDMADDVAAVVDRGIPVVIIDSNLDAAALERRPNLIVKYVATDNYRGGQMAARRLLDVLAREGKKSPNLVLFRYAVGSESTEQREKGFLDAIAEENGKRQKNGAPPVNIISQDKYAGATVDTAEKEAGPLVNSLKDRMDGIFAVNESAATGMLNALRSQGLNGKVRFVAFDSSEDLQRAVREGDVDGLVVQDPYRMGYLGVWVLVKHLEGYDVSTGGTSLSTGEHLVTKENLDDEKTRGLFSPEVQQKRTIEKPTFQKKGEARK